VGPSWFGSTAIDNALEVLCTGVKWSSHLTSKFIVLDTHVITKLVTLFRGEEGEIAEYQACGWFTSIAIQVLEGEKTLVTVAHLGNLPPQKDETVSMGGMHSFSMPIQFVKTRPQSYH
jgi:hypothetical protein